MIAPRIDTHAAEATRRIRLRLRAEGRAAYPNETNPYPPYPPDTQAYREWMHGWWSVYYGYYCGGCGDKHSIQACPQVRALLMRGDDLEEGPEDLGETPHGPGSA